MRDKEKEKEKEKEHKRNWYHRNRAAVRAQQKQRRRELKEWFRGYKASLSCMRCGENHPATLDFHHRDSSKKDKEINRLLAHTISKERMLEEIDKCDVLCSNCHRKLHWGKCARSSVE